MYNTTTLCLFSVQKYWLNNFGENFKLAKVVKNLLVKEKVVHKFNFGVSNVKYLLICNYKEQTSIFMSKMTKWPGAICSGYCFIKGAFGLDTLHLYPMRNMFLTF